MEQIDTQSDSIPRGRRGARFVIADGGDSVGNRGPGSADSSEQTAAFEGGMGEVVPLKGRRGRRPKADVTAARGAADMAIGIVETLAYSRYRTPEARMNPTERKMALDGVADSMKVLPQDVVNQISALSAPVMAIMGFGLYFVRLGEMEQRLRAERRDQRISESVDTILASQPNEPSGQDSANGYVVPPKSYIQGMQEI